MQTLKVGGKNLMYNPIMDFYALILQPHK